MSESPEKSPAGEDHLDADTASDRADEAAKPSDIGALDGAAAAGSASNAGTAPDEEAGVPTSPPDPATGPD